MPGVRAGLYDLGHWPHRRPFAVLKATHAMKRRRAALLALAPELDHAILRREWEPKRRTGFLEVRERDGPGSIPRDARNYLGRPKKQVGSG